MEFGFENCVGTLPFANKHIAFNHEWNITGNYAVRMHKTLKH